MSAAGSMAPLYASMGVSGIGSIGTAYAQSRAIKASGDYQATVADTNAKIAGLEAAQTLEAGDIAASRKNLETTAKVGELRAAQGASGTDVASGSNLLTQLGTRFAGNMDELTIRHNAARTAWGYKTSAINDTYQGKFARMTAANQAQQTLLAGGMAAISGPLSMEANYLRWSKSMGGTSGTPYPTESGTAKT